jgi:proton-dependent oligopeptide transporter, POT family
MNESTAATLAEGPSARTVFGQPRGLATLFLTEMWERFTYYGMRAILILYMVGAVAHGGLGIDDKNASAAYGMYVGGTYLFSLLGGWIADRLLGAQRAIIAGGLLIMLGNATLIVGHTQVFFVGLLVITVGVGLLKPNASATVAALYPEGGARRDAGFSIFYMGINLGATIGPGIVGSVADRFGWRFGFAPAVIGMALGVVQFVRTRHYLGSAGRDPCERGSWTPVLVLFGAALLIVLLALNGVLRLNATSLASSASWAMLVLAIAYFAYLLLFARLSRIERNRVLVMMALFAGSVTFWLGYEQTGASLNLFAERYTDRHLFGWDMPASYLQSVNPLFIMILALVFAWLWTALGRRGIELSPTVKFSIGLCLLGLGFFVMYLAALRVVHGALVLPTWLVLTYFLHSCGELCLSPVGLSYMSKLAPPRFVGQVMGIWFLSLALGSNLAGQLTGEYDASHLETLPALFLKTFWFGVIAALIMLAITPLARRLMAGVR